MGGQRDIKGTIETLIAKHQSFIVRGANSLILGTSFSFQENAACFGWLSVVPGSPYVNFVSRPHYSSHFEPLKLGGRCGPNFSENLLAEIFAVF
jgi:hypothetical protein